MIDPDQDEFGSSEPDYQPDPSELDDDDEGDNLSENV